MIHSILFADAAQPSANMTWVVIAALVSMLGNFSQFLIWLSMRKKQQVEVSMSSDFVPAKVFEKHAEENDEEFRRLWQRRDDDQEAASDSRKGLYQKMDGLEKEIRDMPEKVIQNIVNAQKVGRIK